MIQSTVMTERNNSEGKSENVLNMALAKATHDVIQELPAKTLYGEIIHTSLENKSMPQPWFIFSQGLNLAERRVVGRALNFLWAMRTAPLSIVTNSEEFTIPETIPHLTREFLRAALQGQGLENS